MSVWWVAKQTGGKLEYQKQVTNLEYTARIFVAQGRLVLPNESTSVNKPQEY